MVIWWWSVVAIPLFSLRLASSDRPKFRIFKKKKRKLCYEGGNDIVKHFFTFKQKENMVFANTDVLTAFLNAKCQFY